MSRRKLSPIRMWWNHVYRQRRIAQRKITTTTTDVMVFVTQPCETAMILPGSVNYIRRVNPADVIIDRSGRAHAAG